VPQNVKPAQKICDDHSVLQLDGASLTTYLQRRDRRTTHETGVLRSYHTRDVLGRVSVGYQLAEHLHTNQVKMLVIMLVTMMICHKSSTHRTATRTGIDSRRATTRLLLGYTRTNGRDEDLGPVFPQQINLPLI